MAYLWPFPFATGAIREASESKSESESELSGEDDNDSDSESSDAHQLVKDHGMSQMMEEKEGEDGGNDKSLSPWRNSKSKQRIIDLLKDETSDIHLLIGRHTANDFSNVNFNLLQEKYADARYKPSNFKSNMTRLLKNKFSKISWIWTGETQNFR